MKGIEAFGMGCLGGGNLGEQAHSVEKTERYYNGRPWGKKKGPLRNNPQKGGYSKNGKPLKQKKPSKGGGGHPQIFGGEKGETPCAGRGTSTTTGEKYPRGFLEERGPPRKKKTLIHTTRARAETGSQKKKNTQTRLLCARQ